MLDEHVPHAVAYGLRRRGIDVSTATDATLLNTPDGDILATASDQGRVLVTADDDFFRLHNLDRSHHGIVYYKQNHRSIGEIVESLSIIRGALEPHEMVGWLEFI